MLTTVQNCFADRNDHGVSKYFPNCPVFMAAKSNTLTVCSHRE